MPERAARQQAVKIVGIPQRAHDALAALRRLRNEVEYAIQTGDGDVLSSEIAEVVGTLDAILSSIERAAQESGDQATRDAYARFETQVHGVTTMLNPDRL